MYAIKKHQLPILDKINIIWLVICILSSGFASILQISISYLVGIGFLLAIMRIFFDPNLIFGLFNAVFSSAFVLVLLVAIGVLHTDAPNYGTSKATLLFMWVFYFGLIADLVAYNRGFFIKINLFVGSAIIILLVVMFGNPIAFFTQMQSNSLRLGELGGDEAEVANPIWIARFLGVYLINLVIYKKYYSLNIWVYYLLAIVTVLYLILTGSKGPILASAISLFFVIRLKKTFYLHMVAALIIIFSVYAFVTIEIAQDSFIYQRYFESTSLSSRGDMQAVILQMVGHFSVPELLFGKGTGSTGYVLTGLDERNYPHNIIVELLYENGLTAVLLLMLMLTTILLSIRKFRIEKMSLHNLYFCCLFLYFFINAQFSGDISSNQFLFAFFLFSASFIKIYELQSKIIKKRIVE